MSLDRLRSVLGYNPYSDNDNENLGSGFEERIDPKYYPLILLDDIKVYEKMRYDIEIKRFELESKNQKLLIGIFNKLSTIEKVTLEEADEGMVLRQDGTVTPNQFTIIDTNRDPGHMIKGYTIKNDGPNPIFAAHNAAFSSEVDADIMDTVSNDSRFELIDANDDIKFRFNRDRVRNIHLLASGGNSDFRAWLVW